MNSKINIFVALLVLLGSAVNAEQTINGKINKYEIVNYGQGAVYLYVDGAQFSECPTPTNWCAIDLSLPAANQMFSAALASKMAEKKITVTTNGCWNTNFARCWKVIGVE